MRGAFDLIAGAIFGILAFVLWLIADHLCVTALHSFSFSVRTRSVFSNWATPAIGLAIALVTGYLGARMRHGFPMVAALGVAGGLLAGFILPQALTRGDISLYLAGPEMFIPTILGLVALPLIGGKLGKRTP